MPKKPKKNQPQFPSPTLTFPTAIETWPPYNIESDQFNGLVAWWPHSNNASQIILFDEISGYDMVFGLSGTTPPDWFYDSEFGTVLDYSTEGDDRALFIQQVIRNERPLSMSAWHNSDVGANRVLIGVANSAVNNRYMYLGRKDFVLVSSSGVGVATHTGTETQWTWQHTVGVEAAANERHCYFNGGNKATNTTSVANMVDGATRTAIGWIGRLSSNQLFYNRFMTDARIYKRVLTDADVAAMYDPATRHELYEKPQRIYSLGAAAGSNPTRRRTNIPGQKLWTPGRLG